MICLHRLNPMPEPDVLVVKKGTKILSRTSGKIPSPLSDIVNVGLPLEKNFISMFLSVLRSHVSRAFFNKLISTCSICARSAYKYKLDAGISKWSSSKGDAPLDIPLVYYIINDYIKDFAVKAPIGVGIFVAGFILTSLISLGMLLWQVCKAVRINPGVIMKNG